MVHPDRMRKCGQSERFDLEPTQPAHAHAHALDRQNSNIAKELTCRADFRKYQGHYFNRLESGKMDRQILPGPHNQRTRITRARHRARKDDLDILLIRHKWARANRSKGTWCMLQGVGKWEESGVVGAGWPCRARREESAHIHFSTWASEKKSLRNGRCGYHGRTQLFRRNVGGRA